MIDKRPFGTTQDGIAVEAYTLTNAGGATVEILTYGGIITRLLVPDREGHLGDIVLGFDELAPYETESPYFGALIGRFGNRIAGGKFTLDGKEYSLATNNGPNHLHGGLKGYDKRVWDAATGGSSLRLHLFDADGTEGYPGNVDVTVVYTLTDDNVLRIEYTATTDAPTPINLTNHSYFNLKDGGASDALGHIVQAEADEYLPVDDTLIPTGEFAPVAGTPIDFRAAKPLGQDIEAMGGYDHCLVLRKEPGTFAKAVEVREPTTGRRVEAWTTQPGFQLYSGNFLDGSNVGKGGVGYGKHHAMCMETEGFPDSPHHLDWPLAVLRPGETYRQITEYRFFADA